MTEVAGGATQLADLCTITPKLVLIRKSLPSYSYIAATRTEYATLGVYISKS